MAPRRALVVEDEDLVREVFSGYLVLGGWQVVEAVDGLDGIEQARTHSPDLIVTDVKMPRLDGLEMIRRLRADPQLGRVPILIVSAHAVPNRELRDLPGPIRFVSKAVSVGGFLAAINKLLGSADAATLE